LEKIEVYSKEKDRDQKGGGDMLPQLLTSEPKIRQRNTSTKGLRSGGRAPRRAKRETNERGGEICAHILYISTGRNQGILTSGGERKERDGQREGGTRTSTNKSSSTSTVFTGEAQEEGRGRCENDSGLNSRKKQNGGAARIGLRMSSRVSSI